MINIKEFTPMPLTTIGGNAAYCYGMEDKTNRFRKIAERCLKEGHGRVSEFAEVTIEISGYSAKVIRELYTHIAGSSRLQASTRYVDYSKQFQYITPSSISKHQDRLEVWESVMAKINDGMSELKELGTPIEDFTNLLPLAYDTKMVLKINLRALIHMFNVRACTCAYKEYRELMTELKLQLKELDEEWAFLSENYFVPKCIAQGYCDENTRACGIRPLKSDVLKFIAENKETFNEFVNEKKVNK